MKHVLSFVLSLLCAVLLVAVLRIGVFDILTIPLDGQQPVLMQGDRVLVNKWAYGWRRPFSQWWGYERYAVKKVLRGDWIAFNRPDVSANALPDSSQLCVGQVLACPGDTIWMGMQGRVSMRRDYARGCIWPLVVPARGKFVRITPWSADLYALTVKRHEDVGEVEVKNDSLHVDGHKTEYFRFHRDYYWVISGDEANLYDSRTFGFVPFEFVSGKAVSVVYSLNTQEPWHRRWRWKRMFRPVGEEMETN